MATGVWFRKGLRLHDNAALAKACAESNHVVPFFILDPWFDRSKVGVNRFQFLLDSLRDLDRQLRASFCSRLLVLRGRPEDVLNDLFTDKGPFSLKALYFEKDSEPYAQARDARVLRLAAESGARAEGVLGHTLLDLETVVSANGFKPPISMANIRQLVNSQGPIRAPLPVPRIPALRLGEDVVAGLDVPDISELYEEAPTQRSFPGGETEALKRLEAVCADADFVCRFEKPKTSSTGQPGRPWEPSTTGLSPYLKFGCISVRTAWHALADTMKGRAHTEPPQSLHGQILFREMFYVLGAAVPNFDKGEDNAMCKVIPWGEDAEFLAAWEQGRTGYPFIDALMRQLKETGWMHHLGRHAVACFLTRGDLWQHWTAGRDVFDRLLLDADWAVNNGNWLWLAGVAPFSAPYFRIYDPCPGPKSSLNAEQTGEFVKHFVPELKKLPAKYIYRPWEAPLAVQKQAGCIIGEHYPAPIVDHKAAREENLARFKAALDALKSGEVPEKFGGRQSDPGPMKATYTKGSPSGKGKGKRAAAQASQGRQASSAGSAAAPSAEPASDAPQRKQRRWGGKQAPSVTLDKAFGG